MRRELLDLIGCPSCNADALVVDQASEHELAYQHGPVCEIEHGTVACQSCGARYPVQDYVLSFADLLAPAVRSDGTYWGAYYSRLYDYGITGFLDTRSSPAPFLGMGVPQTLPFEGEEWSGIHVDLAEHRWVRAGGRVVDVGVGSGWSSLFLARRGFEVIAFDPALELMQLAKRYAIAQGVYLEYICADMANFHVRAATVDAVFALHSLHHIPDLEGAMRQIHTMLKQDGCLALDDHFQEVPVLAWLRDGLLQEADEHIFPPLRDPALPQHPVSEHSENEGVGMGQLLPAIERYLHIDDVEYRHVGLDFAGPLFYLQQDCNPEALRYASAVVELLNKAMQRTLPGMVEYVTLVAQKRAELPVEPRYAPGPRDPFVAMQQHIAAMQEYIDAQEREIRRLDAVAGELDRAANQLHAVVAQKNAHIEYLERMLARIENGRVMRLLRWISHR